MACQKTKKAAVEATEIPALATLSQPAFTVGDSLNIQLNEPLSQVSISWDGQPGLGVTPIHNRLVIDSRAQTVGLHQLILTGTTATKTTASDTLSVELWSNLVPTRYNYSVLKTYPHQASSFTQGLEFYKGTLFEGTGLQGESKLMKTDLTSGAILQSVSVPAEFFGEGITILNDRIYQLTWTSGKCFQYSMDLALQQTFTYHTQGWGLTHRDTTLIVSDGSNRLSFYSPTFHKTGELAVYDNKGPVMNLNELEYVGGTVLANVWQTNRIVQIDLATGKVIGELMIDPQLVKGVDTKQDVLNGIAYQGDENAIYITGKNWPNLFKIQVNDLFKTSRKTAVALR